MGWNRQHFSVERKQPRHAHVPLGKACCVDCGRELQTTHLVARFGARCRRCFDALWHAAMAQMASQAER